ncbi:CsbD family protein [Streptomyces sp. NPDC007205]|uniref:CsbD family protein n=1 Tax=Streptomyces sp. NPDC007205 TaxID=3154316 RepID=UPI0033F11919
MSAGEKARAKVEQAKGKLKRATGRAAVDDPMVVEGQAEKSKGDARQAKEKIKDMFKR